MLSYRPDAPRIPAAAISAPDADLLERHAASGSEMRVRLLLRPTTERNAVSGNIVADLPGSDIASEIVLLGAHLDSWDLGQGALDDAAGVAMVIEAALRAAGPDLRARRTIRVVLFGAEEISGRGGQDYATRHAGDTHVLATEADFGAARIWGYFTNVPESDLPFFDSVGRDLASMGIERGHNRAQGGEDIRPLRRAGVPVVSLVQDGTTYFDFHHTANDTFDKIDPAALEQNVQVFSILTERVADR
jgi:Zn-dependent M28 family amino/carboxypeptidase